MIKKKNINKYNDKKIIFFFFELEIKALNSLQNLRKGWKRR